MCVWCNVCVVIHAEVLKLEPETDETQIISREISLLGGSTGVHELTVVVDDALDLAITLKVADGNTGERTTDLHTVDQGRLRDHLEGGHLLEDTVVGRLVKDEHVLGLLWCERARSANDER